jgi:hypothetical protein
MVNTTLNIIQISKTLILNFLNLLQMLIFNEFKLFW